MRCRVVPILAVGLLLLLLPACGGDDQPARPQPQPDPLEPVTVSGRVTGPRDPAGLELLGAFGSATVAADGGYTLDILAGGEHFAVVADAQDRAVYFGSVSPGAPDIDATSTARVILFFAAGAPWLGDAVRTAVFDDPEFVAATDTLAAVIAAAYTAGAADLEEIAPELGAALASLALFAAPAGKTLVDPPGGVSGIDLDTTVPHELTLRNNYRRRALAWVDLVEAVDADGNPVTFGEQVVEQDISPTTAYSSVVGTLVDAIHGRYVWAPVAGAPVAVPLRPDEAQQTTYMVTVLGLGGSWGDYANLTPARQDRFTAIAIKTVFLDFVTPIVVNLAIPMRADGIDAFLEEFGASGAIGDLIGVLSQTVPSIAEKCLAGDLHGAVDDAINAIFTSGTATQIAFDNWHAAILEHWDLATASEFQTATRAFSSAMTIVNAIGTSFDSYRQVRDIAASHVADEWNVTVVGDHVTLTPERLTLQPGEHGPLTAVVRDAAGRAFEYHWACTAGEMDDGIHQGDVFTGSVATVEFHAPAENGSAVVFVDVYEIQGSDRVWVGNTAAEVTVRRARTYIDPRRASLRPGDSRTFTLRTEAGFDTSEPFLYRWSCSELHGRLDSSGNIGSYDHVSYRATGEGVDDLFCEVYVNVNGRLEQVGLAEAEIRVEQEPSLIFGRYRTQDWDTEGGGYGVYADVVWDAVPDAVRYVMTGYGGNDPDYYHEGPIVRTVFADNIQHDHLADMPAGEVWLSLSGAWGGGDGRAGAIAWMESRFGTGWTWEVEVIRQ
ncbi:hypothetical protein KDM41_14750 [bacterium]|nr:hypothetical protein [bacterium]